MSAWRPIIRGLRALVNRRAAERDAADEVRHYLDEAEAALIADGASPDEARRVARVQAGSPASLREQVGQFGWEHVVLTSLADARYAARRLRLTPAFTAVATLTLALGIGASTAIFSAVNPVLFEPLPYPRPDRIVTIWDGSGGSRLDVTFGTFREIQARSRAFDAIAVTRPWQPTLTGTAEPQRLVGQRVSAGYFHTLGIGPILGPGFDAADDRPTGPHVVIVSDALWRTKLGADPAIVGRTMRLDDRPYTVVGVLPPGFENVLAPDAGIWTLLQYDPALPLDGREWGHHLRMIGRLRVDAAAARDELNAMAAAPLPAFPRAPWASLQQGFIVDRLQDDVTRGVRPALLAVLGAVLLVLAIACVNVTNLLLARGAQRQGEMAVRAALGAGRARLVRQLLIETLLLALVSGALGLLIAEAGVRALIALSPPGLPRLDAIGVDGAAFAFACGISAAAGLIVGLFPALRASRGSLHDGLAESSRRTAGGRHWTRSALVVAEVSLALILLVSAGLLLRSLTRLFAVSPGFDASHLLTMQVQAASQRFSDADAMRVFFEQAQEAVERVPGVVSAAFTNQLPLSGEPDDVYGVRLERRPDAQTAAGFPAYRYAVTRGYLATIGIPLRRGRALTTADGVDAPRVALISESFARTAFAGGDPIGQRIAIGGNDAPWTTIVGIVGNARQTSLAVNPVDAVYVPAAQWPYPDRARWLLVRTHGDAAALAAPVQEAVWSVDRNQPVDRVGTMEGLVTRSAAERRFALVVFEAFAIVALVLAAIGLYGVLAGSVVERRREIGIRSALGASRGSIIGLILRHGVKLTWIGAVIGLGGAVLTSRGLVSLLYGVTPLDPVTYLGTVLLLFVVAACAGGLPAWRAARVDPSITLRAE
ncbi:MAG TPA: ABC transporter permease [Vicinamibacterales bacterium]|nr:ABC transporter permease [Vicinamibacterales bacterium]